jgi:5'-nucleotidase
MKLTPDMKWLLSNLIDKTTGKPLAGGLVSDLVTWNGFKVGIIGLAEEEWITTLGSCDTTQLEYKDFVSEGRRLAIELKKQGAEFVFAITHMRLPNDEKLAREVDEIDVILGGHDHFYDSKIVNGKPLLKSGVDFNFLTTLKITVQEGSKPTFDIEKIEINTSIPEDPEMAKTVEEVSASMEAQMKKIIIESDVTLNTKSEHIRQEESLVGNLTADALRSMYSTDIAIVNAGSIRSDGVYNPGDFSMKDLMSIFPFEDVCVSVKMTGKQLWATLENGVSHLPAQEGRFPCIAGFSFTFDSTKPSGHRVVSVTFKNEPVKDDQIFTCAAKLYMVEGHDGYETLVECRPLIIDEENGQMLSTVLLNYFRELNIVRAITATEDQLRVIRVLHRLRKEKGKNLGRICPVLENRIVDVSKAK